MKLFKIYKTSYQKKMPKIQYIYHGYRGLKRGLCLLWNKRMIPLVLPINER